MGARWRVGDGRLIQIYIYIYIYIYFDSWIPGNLGRKIISLVVSLHRNATISDLIDLESKWWKS